MSLLLHPQRVKGFFAALKKQHAAEIPTVTAFIVVCGTLDDTPENQRGVAIVQHLFSSPNPVENISLIFQPTGELIVVTTRDVSTIVTEGVDSVRVLSSITGAEDSLRSELASVLVGDVGVAQRELALQRGSFATGLIELVGSLVPTAHQKDVAPFLGALLFVKDSDAIDSITKAGSLCVAALKRFARPHLEETLSSGRAEQLDAFETMILYKLEHPNEINGMAAIQFDHFAPSLPQRVMHMGAYVSSVQSVERSTAILKPDVVCIRFGVRHKGEAAFIGRTYIIEKNAPAEAIAAYAFISDVHKELQAQLTVGARLSDVFHKTMSHASSKNSQLASSLVKNFGYVTGLLVLEARGSINEKSTTTVAPGMAFVIRVVAENVPTADGRTVGVEISDTVVVAADGSIEMKTKLGRELNDVKYTEEENDAEADEAAEQQQRDLRAITRSGRSAVPLVSREEERDEKRRRLLAKLHAEFLSSGGKNRTVEDVDVVRTQTIGQIATGDLVSYPVNAPKPDFGASMLRVHREKKVAWIPICGVATPFHVSTINRVELKKEGNHHVLTIVFHSLQETNVAYRMNRTKVFVKDVSFSSPKEETFHEFVRSVNDCIRDIKQNDLANKNNQGVAKTGGLKLIPNPKKLPNIKIRPALMAGKHAANGNLEIHENGLRFSTLGAAPVEILYSNVKHFIFQPAKNSISTIFHVTLKQPILLNMKKKADEISFYADVLEASESVEGTRKTYEQELEQEEKERQRVDGTNREFAIFAKEVHAKSGRNVELPMDSFQVDGVTSKELTGVRASNRVIWAISSIPAFTLSVSDIELMSLERVTDTGINFDINFIPKHYKSAIPITTVPRSSLEVVKEWALQADVYYVESSINIAWNVLLKKIREDPDWEPFGPGGWNALAEDDDEEDEEDNDDDSDPSYDSEEDEEDDDDDDDDSDSEFSSFYSDSSLSTDDDAESSEASWDAMERKANKHDRENDFSDESDDDRPRRKAPRPNAAPKARAGAKAPPAAPSKAPGKIGGKVAMPQSGPGSKFAVRPGMAAPPSLPRRF